MKKIAFLLLVIAFASSGCATALDVPGEIPSNISWLLIAKFDSTDTFDTAKIYIDGTKIVTMYTQADGSGNVSETDSTKVLKAFAVDADTGSKEGLQLYVSFFGLGEGSHIVKLETSKNSSLVGELSKEVIAYKALSERVKTEINNRIDELSDLSEELSGKISSLESSSTEQSDEIQGIKSTLEEISTSLSALKGSVETLDAETAQELEGMQLAVSGLDAELLQAESDLNALSKRGAVMTATGLASFGGFDPLLGLLVILSIIAIFWFANFAQNRKGTIYGEKPILPSFGARSKYDIEEAVDEVERGRWGFDEKEEPKRFHLGDLIKKK